MWWMIAATAWANDPTWVLEAQNFGGGPVPEWAEPWVDGVRKGLSTCIEPGQKPGWVTVRLVAKASKPPVPSVRADESAGVDLALCLGTLGDKAVAAAPEARTAELRLAIHTGTPPAQPSAAELPLPEKIDIGDLIGSEGIQIK